MTAVALPKMVDLAAATQLAETLRTLPGPVSLDGAAVERIGVAGLQVLLSAKITAAAAGHALEIERPSPPLLAAALAAGVSFLVNDR